MAKSNPHIRKAVVPKEHLVEEFATDPLKEGRSSASQSPQAQRGSAQDFSKFGDREVRDGITWKEDAAASGPAWERATPLNIEKTNPKK
jgi:hypothetical protein